MKLGDVLRKERERKRLGVETVATRLNVPVDDYQELEAGSSPIEQWAPKLAQIAIQLSTPTSRLISETGKSRDAAQCGELIRAHREKRELGQEQLAKSLGWQVSELDSIEAGKSPLENYAPMLLKFSELIEQPIFNLFYPCGLPLNQLEDYP
ncbi:MAG TPA: helix-turn-helix domain-containing protein [Pyrinomonadaceae bacterium]|nr:helix-turn-helix domain-containing protein [Pyrinomonadaceae bacterium]